jgi:hypothetical protein
MSPRCARVLVVTLVIMTIGGISPSVAKATTRDEGTMLVYQSADCSGTGNDPSVSVPFSLLFTGFPPDVTGTVTAFTQPGGDQVGQGTVTVGPDGERCVLVTGEVPAGQYKIVYDFGSGTGKQKVIQITDSEPQPTETATAPTVTPTAPTETATAPTVTPTAPTVTPSTPTVTPTTPTVTPSTPTVTPTTNPPSSATSSPSTEVGHLKFTQLPKTQVAPESESLAKTGGLRVAALTLMGSGLLGLGVLLAATSPRIRRNNR